MANVGLVGEAQQAKFPLGTALLQDLEQAQDGLPVRGVPIDEVFQHRQLGAARQHHAAGGEAITSGAAYLLAVVLDGFGQIVVNDPADIGLVDAHAKGDGGDDAVESAGHEVVLDLAAQGGIQPRMIGTGADADGLQLIGALLRTLLQGDVDDGGGCGIAAQFVTQPTIAGTAGQRNDGEIQIGAIETCHHQILGLDGKFGLHVCHDRRGGGGGEQQYLGNGEIAAMVRQLQVVGPKVVAPFRDAVRLVHHQQGERHLGDEAAKALVLEALHRDHQDLELAVTGLLHHPPTLLGGLAGVQGGGGDPLALQEGELIVHQRQQGGDDQGQMGQCQRGQLVAEGLACTGREDGSRTLAGQQAADHRFLAGSQLIEAEVSGQ